MANLISVIVRWIGSERERKRTEEAEFREIIVTGFKYLSQFVPFVKKTLPGLDARTLGRSEREKGKGKSP